MIDLDRPLIAHQSRRIAAPMRGYRAVTFVGDWFRVVPEGWFRQETNVIWLSRLLAPSLGASFPAPAIIMPASDMAEFAGQLGNKALFERFQLNHSDAWASVYDGDVGHDCFARLYDAIPSGNLIVGFEIPPVMKREIAARGFDYVSLHLHPIRFLRDLTFTAYTNAPGIAASLAAITCHQNEIARRVAHFLARFARLDSAQVRLPDGIPMLFGQTAVDSALIANGGFARWHDYADELAALLSGHEEVAFFRHPAANWRSDIIHFLRKDLGKTIVGISGNSYAHIMSGRLSGPAVTLSSSLGVEAEIFGHDSHFLLADPRDKFAISNLDIPIRAPLDHRIFEPEFWARIMTGTGLAIDPRPTSFHLGENYVRGTLWETLPLDLTGAELLPPTEKWVIPTAEISSNRLDELASIVAGATPSGRQAAIEAAARNRIDLKFLPAPLAVDNGWHWNSSIAVPEFPLASGFHGVEAAGVWSSEPVCQIEIPIQNPQENGMPLSIECKMAFSFFSGIVDQSPAILVRADDIPVAGVFQSPSAEHYHRISWNTEVATSGYCIIRIECSHMSNQLTINGETGRVGIMIHDISVHPRPDRGNGDMKAFRLWGLDDGAIEVDLAFRSIQNGYRHGQ